MIPTSAKDAFEKLSFTTLFLFYLFICGALYLLGFWLHFNLDITSFINTLDVPKALVQPFSDFYFTLLEVSLIFATLTYLAKLPNVLKTLIAVLIMILICTRIIIVKGERLFENFEVDVYIIYFLLQIVFLLYLESLLRTFIKQRILVNASCVVILFPFFCLVGGMLRGNDIKRNKHILLIENLRNSTPLYQELVGKKLVGFAGDKMIFSSIDNNHFYIIKQDAIPSLRFMEASK